MFHVIMLYYFYAILFPLPSLEYFEYLFYTSIYL